MNDERTITAIKNRNEAAINEVITKYSKLLWAVAGAVLNNMGSTQDVEECVADTFIYLWEHPDKYDPQRGKLKTWLSIVARTQAVNRCREISKRNTISLENTDFIDQLGVVDNILEAETRKSLIAAVNALGEPDREILIRRYSSCASRKELNSGNNSCRGLSIPFPHVPLVASRSSIFMLPALRSIVDCLKGGVHLPSSVMNSSLCEGKYVSYPFLLQNS